MTLIYLRFLCKKNENRFCLGIAGTEKETADEEKNKEKEEKDEKMDTS